MSFGSILTALAGSALAGPLGISTALGAGLGGFAGGLLDGDVGKAAIGGIGAAAMGSLGDAFDAAGQEAINAKVGPEAVVKEAQVASGGGQAAVNSGATGNYITGPTAPGSYSDVAGGLSQAEQAGNAFMGTPNSTTFSTPAQAMNDGAGAGFMDKAKAMWDTPGAVGKFLGDNKLALAGAAAPMVLGGMMGQQQNQVAPAQTSSPWQADIKSVGHPSNIINNDPGNVNINNQKEQQYTSDFYDPNKYTGGLYAQGGQVQRFAAGGAPKSTGALQMPAGMEYAQDLPGRLINGEGNGNSDSVRASIDGQELALLSDGEYVLPATFVSAVGNGSTKAGAKELDRLVQAVVGKNKLSDGNEKFKKGLSELVASGSQAA